MARPELLLLSVLLIATISVVASVENCRYTIKTKTGTKSNSGTDSVIGVTVADQSGNFFQIKNLETWGGAMPQGHDYYENGNLDIFSGKAACLPNPVCFLTLKSDGSGGYAGKPGWYVEYVEVETVKIGSKTKVEHFRLEQWLARDEPPYVLTTERDNCPDTLGFEIRKSLYSVI